VGIRGLSDPAAPWQPASGGGLRLAVRLTPKAGRNGVTGIKPTAAGGGELDVRVTAVPEKGRANAALIALLAKALQVPAGAITLVAGDTDRHKQLHIAGDAAALGRALQDLVAGQSRKG